MTDIHVATDLESFTKVARDAPSDIRVPVEVQVDLGNAASDDYGLAATTARTKAYFIYDAYDSRTRRLDTSAVTTASRPDPIR